MKEAKAVRYDKQEAIDHLRTIIKPGDTVYTVLRHVSRSGMSRGIDVYALIDNSPVWITGYVGKAIDSPQSRKDWEQSRGLRIGGCGMDMGFHVVNSLSYAIYPEYKCLGKKGNCPSNYHVNHRDRVNCEGVPRYAVYYLQNGRMEKGWETFSTRDEAKHFAGTLNPELRPEVEADYLRCWPSETIRLKVEVEGEVFEGRRAYTLHHDDETEEICPICKGEGRVDNPEGPERWNLTHKDGYALRHKWL